MRKWGSILAICLLLLDVRVSYLMPYNKLEETPQYWLEQGIDTLARVLARPTPTTRFARPAKNVIMFIGDGMGMSTITAARIYKGQRLRGASPMGEVLAWDRFPSIGLVKTYNLDKQVPDSAGTATAMFTGVKSRYRMLGLDGRATKGSCEPNQDPERKLQSVMTWAQKLGKHTGFVTTTRVTHATPAALYASINDRDWECDTQVPVDQKDCVLDIARQLVELSPGKNFQVILGGGLKQFGQVQDYAATWDDSCVRGDGRDLVQDWIQGRQGGVFVRTLEELNNVSDANYLLGLFSPGHIPYTLETNVTDYSTPTLKQMTLRAIEMLSRNEKGYILMVEGGRIDSAHHENMAHMALEEVVQLDAAVEAALRVIDLEDTLVIVTADHSHGFNINGYAERGSDIFGMANKPNEEEYEMLTYATGPGAAPTLRGERSTPYYRNSARTYLKSAAHAGEDVPIYATGQFSHLFTGVFEQNYIAHAVGYAACMGPNGHLCNKELPPEPGSRTTLMTSSSFIRAPDVLLYVLLGCHLLKNECIGE